MCTGISCYCNYTIINKYTQVGKIIERIHFTESQPKAMILIKDWWSSGLWHQIPVRKYTVLKMLLGAFLS